MMKLMPIPILVALILLAGKVYGEYRVYQFAVRSNNPYSLDRNSRVVTSTLDPVSYLAYHGGSITLQIDLLRTWMCYGDTSHQDVCQPPLVRGQTSEGGQKQ